MPCAKIRWNHPTFEWLIPFFINGSSWTNINYLNLFSWFIDEIYNPIIPHPCFFTFWTFSTFKWTFCFFIRINSQLIIFAIYPLYQFFIIRIFINEFNRPFIFKKFIIHFRIIFWGHLNQLFWCHCSRHFQNA